MAEGESSRAWGGGGYNTFGGNGGGDGSSSSDYSGTGRPWAEVLDRSAFAKPTSPPLAPHLSCRPRHPHCCLDLSLLLPNWALHNQKQIHWRERHVGLLDRGHHCRTRIHPSCRKVFNFGYCTEQR
ncbi:hypothetical protein GOP47_0015762 [Adiantum capillus-veneris]|uniref:Uncharacterized protein n=1 Tax=Adiantum capillus-veneris TaxID=13818 RepID=A0A9D4ZE99_ADICA|nr:hypothetical protein GOP47_0015762 [Adiantum capillus-veneris]